MSIKYAEGRKAWGHCERCGMRYLLKQLTSDGYKPDLLVCQPCWDEDHPQERLPDTVDPIALYEPTGDLSLQDSSNQPAESSPVLTDPPLISLSRYSMIDDGDSSTAFVSGGTAPISVSFVWASAPPAGVSFVVDGNTIQLSASETFSGTINVIATDADNRVATASISVETSFPASLSIDWTEINVAPLGAKAHVTYGDGKFVAAFGTHIYTSADGLNWTAGRSDLPIEKIRYVNGIFFAYASYGPTYYTSVDGLNWSAAKSFSGFGGDTAADFGWAQSIGKFFVVQFSSKDIFTSPDGNEPWTELPDTLASIWPDVSFVGHDGNRADWDESGNVYIGSAYNSTDSAALAVTSDLVNFTELSGFSDVIQSFSSTVFRAAVNGSTIVVAAGSDIATSTDGGASWAWINDLYIPNLLWGMVIWDGERFVATGWGPSLEGSSRVAYSIDGLSWTIDTERFFQRTNSGLDVATDGAGLYVASCDQDGYIVRGVLA